MADAVGPRIYRCFRCGILVSRHDDIINKDFQSTNGRAFLFSHATNIVLGEKEHRLLISGPYTVSDVYCSGCRECLGWKYHTAYFPDHKYKEGKIVLEKLKIVRDF